MKDRSDARGCGSFRSLREQCLSFYSHQFLGRNGRIEHSDATITKLEPSADQRLCLITEQPAK